MFSYVLLICTNILVFLEFANPDICFANPDICYPQYADIQIYPLILWQQKIQIFRSEKLDFLDV